MVNSDFVNLIEKLLDLRWCMPTQLAVISDNLGGESESIF
jgi:hypothetical protein